MAGERFCGRWPGRRWAGWAGGNGPLRLQPGRKIVGYDCSDNLEMEGVMRAGARAIRELSSPGSFMSYHFLIEKHNVRVRIRATYRNRNVVQCGVKAPTESTQRRPDTRYEEVSGSLPSHGEIGDEPKIFQIFGFIR